jgi:hypothetical protein
MRVGVAFGHSVGVEAIEAEISEMIFFEIPAYADVEQFCRRIRPHWPGWKMLDVDVWLVGATVKVDDVDLAVLLRTVEAAITELGLLAIRYCLDGRFYVMDEARVERPAEAASPVADQQAV